MTHGRPYPLAQAARANAGFAIVRDEEVNVITHVMKGAILGCKRRKVSYPIYRAVFLNETRFN
ncbi:hypothetical protein HMEPL2_17760 [Vreelandella aquamarina]|uniref:Uncharacterized protein n=1 Tax=Vreelandella aquamarina TaxID=77097 RepID=A0A6F8XCM5_9GAMM|nr:hypothetical protein HMEPL2_17760 [Halomonas meridiana]